MTIDIAAVRAHVDTDLVDAAITRLIDDAAAAVEERAGSQAEQTVTLRGGDPYLFLPQPVSEAADVTEIIEYWSGTAVTLADDDWRWWGGRQLERRMWGTNARDAWAHRVDVTYTPKADTARQDRVTIDLVRLAIQYNALGSERAGDFSSSSLPDYQAEREKLLAELVPKAAFA